MEALRGELTTSHLATAIGSGRRLMALIRLAAIYPRPRMTAPHPAPNVLWISGWTDPQSVFQAGVQHDGRGIQPRVSSSSVNFHCFGLL